MLFTKAIAIILLIYSTTLFAQKLPELQTKQALDNIRLISKDGKFTYYQQRSGDLQMATNYANKIILKNPKGTHYLLKSTQARKKISIEMIKNFYKRLDFFALNEIFLMDFGKTEAEPIAQGTHPLLHLQDRWLSYFHPRQKKIFLQNLSVRTNPLSIQLRNSVNPYFVPQVIMPTPDTVLFTDINKQGYMAIQMYTLSEKKISTVYKSKFPGLRLDFCTLEEKLYVGEFSYDGVNLGSSIMQIPLFNNPNFKKLTPLYQSDLPDIGHLICDKESLYFIKTTKFDDKINLKTTEALKLDLATNKTKILTSLQYVTNIIAMDGMILVPFRDRYYVAKGQSILNQDALKKGDKK